MQQALSIAGPPFAAFLAVWLYARVENHRVEKSSRRRMALLAGSAFLIVPLLAPPVFDGGKTAEVQGFLLAVSATCAFGLAITALRTMPARKLGPLLLMLLSGAVVSLSFWDNVSRRF